MKHVPFVASAIACLAFSAAPPAHADAPPSDLIAQVKSAYQNQCALIKAADYDTFTKTMTDDYVEINVDGKKSDRSDIVIGLKGVVAQTGLKLTDCDLVIASSDRSGSDVTVTVTLTEKGTIPRARGSAALEDATHERDVWTNVDGKWLQKSQTVLGEVTKLDGQIVQSTGTM